MARLLVLTGLLLAAASPRPDAPDAAPAGPAALITGSAAAAPSPAPVAGDDPPLALPPIAGPAPGSPAAFRIAAPPPRASARSVIPLLSLAPKQSPPRGGLHPDHLAD